MEVDPPQPSVLTVEEALQVSRLVESVVLSLARIGASSRSRAEVAGATLDYLGEQGGWASLSEARRVLGGALERVIGAEAVEAGLADVALWRPPAQRSFRSATEVPPGSATADQLALMRGLVDGTVTGADFARGWLAARRRALDAGERTRDALGEALDAVFWLLEDEYTIDPELREPADLDDPALAARVAALLLRAEQPR
ncbi:MAG: colicin immunity domain-containing protein [Kineosporiaceae bacterium]